MRRVVRFVGEFLVVGAVFGLFGSLAIGQTVDLSITTAVTPQHPVAGSSFVFTITIQNASSGAATNVVVSDLLPTGSPAVLYQSVTASQGTGCKVEKCGAVVSCNLGTLPAPVSPAPFTQATMTVTVVPQAAGCLTNKAGVFAEELDGVLSNSHVSELSRCPVCTGFTITPTSMSAGSVAGSQQETITGSFPAGCDGGSWTTAGNGSWLTVSPATGAGSGTATVSWTQNSSSARQGSATIAGNTLTVNQAAPACTSFSISPTAASSTCAAGSQPVAITGSPWGCAGGSWTTVGNGSWLTVTPSSGSGSGSAAVSWTQNATTSPRSGAATIAGNALTVSQAGVLPWPMGVTATAQTPTSVSVTWTPVSGASSYDVYRSSGGGSYTPIGSSGTASFTDSSVVGGRAYLYKVMSMGSGGCNSGLSAPDLATTVIFTDPILAAGAVVRAAHITELRTAVNAVRALASSPGGSFTDPTLTTVRAIHFTELLTALNEARSQLLLGAVAFTDPAPASGGLIQAIHMNNLRGGVW